MRRERRTPYDKIILAFIIAMLSVFFICINAFAIERWEAESYIGKEVSIRLITKTKNQKINLHLFVLLIDVKTLNGNDYLAIRAEEENYPPHLISCKSVTSINKWYPLTIGR